MMFGHIETIDELLEHLLTSRPAIESLARNNGGSFGASICWTFQPDTPHNLAEWKPSRRPRGI
jgi:2-iminoacetate synthase ThiH